MEKISVSTLETTTPPYLKNWTNSYQSMQAEQAAEKLIYFAIPSEVRNPSLILRHEKKERFLASLGMTKGVGPFFRSLFSLLVFFQTNSKPIG